MTPASADNGDTSAQRPAGSANARRDAVADALSPQARRGRAADPHAHTRAVNMAKVALPALAALILLVIAVWPLFTGPGEVRQAGPEAGGLEMVDARFVGTDPKSRPFEVRAERVAQSGGTESAVELVKPRAEITLPGGEWITLSAEAGRYDRDSGKLLLTGQVALYHDGGYEFMTDRAELDTKQGIAWGDAAVRGQGPIGTIEAGGFRITNEGDTIVFTGRSRLRLENGTEQEPG
ncbi:LPS export ABC transporter periplasmic protein LptC [Indioceanicola profundi]|uniref:LPS export ABC transporter periplasmic protein LptC n=1 Tax=Indioceanicola profundi TaxID=2220096 RepID=UPI000E6AB89A|nr:LPS export ABC transporter periplasmic protein LptC [Indioceanicola profundi]